MVIGRSGFVPPLGESDEARFEDTLRIVGVRGGVILPAPWSELRDALFCRVGVLVRSTLLTELELGVLLAGLLCSSLVSSITDDPSLCFGLIGDETGDDGGSAVAAAVPSDKCCKLSESAFPSLFVDSGMSL